MKLHHLRNVVAVVDRGSLRAGARHLGLAQPAVSRSIKELEQELGLVLFERNKFGMTLTRAGEVFVRRAKGIQAELARTLEEMEHLKGEDRGTITVGCSSATLIAMVPTIVNRFHVKYPNIRIKLLEGSLPMLETQIRDGLVDLYYGP
ncbi:MAG: LysR family transcriptional regulator, partial [Novosphingobium sp.]|nr:LysR family transcriptional regulator [Novosphingobium sp.]